MMYMRAHGNHPAPEQRPMLAGGLAAVAGSVLAGWALFISGAMRSQQMALHVGGWQMMAVQALIWIGGGALFGRIFSRAAADKAGGWLFGLSFGYVLWMIGPATSMQWIAHGPVGTGRAAMGLFAGYLMFGLFMGAAYPWTSSLFRPNLAHPRKHEFSAAREVTNPAKQLTGEFEKGQ